MAKETTAMLMALRVVFFASLWCAGAGQASVTVTPFNASLVPTGEATRPTGVNAPFACPSELTAKHTCKDGCTEHAWARKRYCHCDALCVRYGDCCPDYRWFCVDRANISETFTANDDDSARDHGSGEFDDDEFNYDWPPFPTVSATSGDFPVDDEMHCVQTIDFNPMKNRPRLGYLLIATCPPNWTGDPAIFELCTEEAQFSGLTGIPVLGTKQRHYKNIYCALCHGEMLADLTFWSIVYSTENGRAFRFLNRTQLLQIAGNPNSTAAVSRILNPPGYDEKMGDLSNVTTPSLRACVIVDQNVCPISSEPDSDPRDLCVRYLAPIAYSGKTYRNLNCLQCGLSSLDSVPWRKMCKSLKERDIGRGSSLSLATIFLFSDRADAMSPSIDESIKYLACEMNQIYDPFLKICRDLSCPDGFFLEDGVRCVRSPVRKTSGPHLVQNVEVRLAIMTSALNEYDEQATEDHSVIWKDLAWKDLAYKAANKFISHFPGCNEKEDMSRDVPQTKQETRYCHPTNVTWSCSTDAIFKPEKSCLMESVTACAIKMSFQEDANLPEQFLNKKQILAGKCFQDNFGNYTIQLRYLAIETPCHRLSNDPHKAYNGSRESTVLTSTIAYISESDSGDMKLSQNVSCDDVILDCPLLTFSENDYVITGILNDTIELVKYDRVFDQDDFRLKPNGEIEVCNFLQDATPSTVYIDGGWDMAHTVLTVGGGVLSLIGLVATITTYVAFPALHRSVAGKSLMCLVTSLFFAQLTMLIGLQRTEVRAICATFAISSHYFWLASFFWMNVLAIDIYRTFGIGTKLSDPSSRRSLHYYALYGWIGPMLIVCACVVLSFCECTEADIFYGSSESCWIGNRNANMLSFGVPIISVLCINAVLFSLTVAGIRKTQKASEQMDITQGQGGSETKMRLKTDLVLYLKLTVIMGLTWILGFVASFAGVQFFWYPFIVLNSLQGALVCLAFVCNKRVLTMWKAKVKGRESLLSSTSNSSRRPQRPQRSCQTSLSGKLTKDNEDTELSRV